MGDGFGWFHHRHRRMPPAWHGGFTLVELLVVIGIIALLIAILLPTIMSAQAQARTITCGSNVRGLCQALYVYAANNRGCFPPNVTGASPKSWYDADRIGRIVSRSKI